MILSNDIDSTGRKPQLHIGVYVTLVRPPAYPWMGSAVYILMLVVCMAKQVSSCLSVDV